MGMSVVEDIPILLANRYGAVSGAYVRGGGDDYSGSFFRAIRLKIDNSNVDQPYKQHIWTYACITAKATSLKSVPFLIVKPTKEAENRKSFSAKTELRKIRGLSPRGLYKCNIDEINKRGFEVVENGPAYDLFNNPNPLMTADQLIESWVIYMDVTGAVFWVMEDQPGQPIDDNKFPSIIWPYGQDAFEPDQDGNDALVGWKRKAIGKAPEKPYKLNQVLRFYRFDPYNRLAGLSRFDVTDTLVQQDWKAGKFNEAFFDNGADPGGIIRVPGEITDPKKRKAILTDWNDNHKGVFKSNKTGLLTNGAEFQWSPRSHHDMEFIDGLGWNRDGVFAAHGVPKMQASIYEDLQLATAQIADKKYWTDTIIPEGRYIEDVVNARLFSGKIREVQNQYALFDFSGIEALRDDMDKKSEIATRLFNIGIPLNDINERLEMGFDEYEWGDAGYIPFSLQQAGIESSDDNGDTNPLETPAADGKKSGKVAIITNRVKVIEKAQKEKLWDVWVQRVFFPIEKKFKSKIRKYFFDLRIHQLSKWDSATKSVVRSLPDYEDLDAILFNKTEWMNKLKTVSSPFIKSAAQSSLDQVFDEIGSTAWGIEDPRVMSILQMKENKIVGITERFWDSLKTSIGEGLQNSETVTEISERIKGQFNIWSSPTRALTIARTETAQCASSVRYKVYQGEGVKLHEWVNSNDEHVRDHHVAFETVGPQPIGYNWMDAIGEPGRLLHPSDMGGPAGEVINCRCLTVAQV